MMEFTQFKKRPGLIDDKKSAKRISAFEKLIIALSEKEIPPVITDRINGEINKVNTFKGSDQAYLKQLQKSKIEILQWMEKELNLVPKNHYMMRWLALGMAVFGAPMGVVFGVTLKNMAFIGIGIPIGMSIGMMIGASMDKKALLEGRQIDVEISS